jgi:predicted molibdopterin-dependent oxidoreductase YjgC
MFRHIEGQAPRRAIAITVEGREVKVREGEPLALALLEAGVERFRETPVSGAARAPLCLMGVCFDCMVEVDGQPNVQACMVTVREGMRVRVQHGARRPETAR